MGGSLKDSSEEALGRWWCGMLEVVVDNAAGRNVVDNTAGVGVDR